MNGFVDWLVADKKMSTRSAKDVLSRILRVTRMVHTTEIGLGTNELLQDCAQFECRSVFVKSQLKRAVNLYLEFKEHEKD